MYDEEKEIIEEMLENTRLDRFIECIAECGEHLVIVVSWDTPNEVLKKLRKLTELDYEDYWEASIFKGSLIWDEPFSRYRDSVYLLEEGYCVVISDDEDLFMEISEYIDYLIDSHRGYLKLFFKELRDTQRSIGYEYYNIPEKFIILLDQVSWDLVDEKELVYIKSVPQEDYEEEIYFWTKRKRYISVDEDGIGYILSEFVRRVDYDVEDEDVYLSIIYHQSLADRVALLNPYTGEVLRVISSKGLCTPKQKIIFDPNKKKFIFPDGDETKCPPPVV